ncbi:MAG TPA: L-2-hydroxyglutarate oxidase [Solirubrobacterales bacterium]|nr:L-2-hydroxyglutarate oxidase [Solirubrobacterales bacterium]
MATPPETGSDPPRECDLAVVGAGVVGLAAARELALRSPDARLCVLEREPRVAAHQTSHSSGVIHAGIYYRPGSLKARLCVAGARELYAYCAERGIPARRTGKVIVAVDPPELPRLDELERRGHANGVPGLRRIDADELREIEPHARGLGALHSPATGVVDFGRVAAALAEDLASAGATVHTNCEVRSTTAGAGGIELTHARGTTRARAAVLCAGAWSDRLAVAAGAPADPRIVPFRGAFLRLRPERAHLVRTSIYPVPDPELPFLGVHLTRGLDGAVHIGPSALMAGARDAYRLRQVNSRDLAETLAWPGTRRLLRRHWRTALAEIRRAASRRAMVAELARFVPELRVADVEPGFAGVRAQALARDGTLVDDFVISRTERAVHVRNAPSPAATSALALARLIADQVEPALD